MSALPQPTGLLALLLHEGDFSWTHFDVHPSVLVGCVLLLGLYGWGIRRGFAAVPEGPSRSVLGVGEGGGPAVSETVPWRRVVAFVAGTVLLFLALDGPLHDLSDDYLFSAHMVQHLLLTLVVPPLWLLGIPSRLLDPMLRWSWIRRGAALVTSPLVAYAIYNVVFAGWHLPGFYNLALEEHALHIVQHLMFIGAAVLVWWPVVNPLPALREIQTPMRIVYLFALGIPMSFVSAMITFARSPLYPWYVQAPRVFDLGALQDQQLGGVIMWVPGMLVFWVAVTIIFFRWASREERDEVRERQLLAARTR